MSTSISRPKYNPYDFANPVTDKDLFSGRKKQLEEIHYYLEQASMAPRPINLALLGNRAAGKTSLLNMISIQAKELGFCVVRIDLNEGDAESQLAFFYKLFDGVLTEVCSFEKKAAKGAPTNCFGGVSGKTYDTYLDMTSAYQFPTENIWSPFIFPIQYAKAMSKGAYDVKVSDANLRKDLACISAEVGTPIAILFDECNVLSSKRILLEMIRNIFMNMPGFMLVFTGTYDLFPVMDEVFSPIVRQFKRIDVDPFVSRSEIMECIRKPFKDYDDDIVSEIIGRNITRQLHDIHTLTGGRPYEIQLLCHFMYKRYERAQDKNMELSLDVVTDVLNELSTGKDLHARKVIASVQEIDLSSMKALRLLASCCGKASFEDIWSIEYMLNGTDRWKKEEFKSQYDYLVCKNILKIEDDTIYFNGDDFDKIYSKYFSKQTRDFNLTINEYSQETLISNMLLNKLRKSGVVPLQKNISYFLKSIEESPDVRNKKTSFEIDLDISKEEILCVMDHFTNCDTTIFEQEPVLSQSVYTDLLNLVACGAAEFNILKLLISSRFSNTSFMLYYKHNELGYEKSLESLETIISRGSEVGVDITYERTEIDISEINNLTKAIINSKNIRTRELALDGHSSRVVDDYIDGKIVSSFYHANIVYELDVKLELYDTNNIGYLFMSRGEYDKAYAMFNKVSDCTELANIMVLIYYNLGVLELLRKRPLKAVGYLTKCIDLIVNDDCTSDSACLLIPEQVDGKIVVRENLDSPDVLTAARQTLKIIEGCSTCVIHDVNMIERSDPIESTS